MKTGNVASMTDYHGNATTYAYSARNQTSTLTAPGSKTWTFTYYDNGALNGQVHANGCGD